jgi:hypothetical protein
MNRCEAALGAVEACCARQDWDGVEETTEALADTYDHLTDDVIQDEAIRALHTDRLRRAAALALDALRADAAFHVINAGWFWLRREASMLKASAEGDWEIGAAYVIVAGHAPESEAAYRFILATARWCAPMLFDSQVRDAQLLAVAAMRGALSDLDFNETAEDHVFWAEAHGLPHDRVSLAGAVIRLAHRRRPGEHDEVLEESAAPYGELVHDQPALLAVAADCALRCIERGRWTNDAVFTYALHAMLVGQEEQARARVDDLIATSKPSHAARLRNHWDNAKQLAASAGRRTGA